MYVEYDGMTVCIDDVTGLDAFIEVEKLSDAENDEAVQEDLKAFLLSLGIGQRRHCHQRLRHAFV